MSERWMATPSGLRGPFDLVRQAEATLEDQASAALAGRPTSEVGDPLVAVLVLTQLGHAVRERVRAHFGGLPMHVRLWFQRHPPLPMP